MAEAVGHGTIVAWSAVKYMPLDPDKAVVVLLGEIPAGRKFLAGEQVEISTVGEIERLRALVLNLGTHLSFLCGNPENWKRRYDIETGAPCPGCYDARDEFVAYQESLIEGL